MLGLCRKHTTVAVAIIVVVVVVVFVVMGVVKINQLLLSPFLFNLILLFVLLLVLIFPPLLLPVADLHHETNFYDHPLCLFYNRSVSLLWHTGPYVSLYVLFLFFFVLLLFSLIPDTATPFLDQIVESILNQILTHLSCRPNFVIYVSITMLSIYATTMYQL